MSRHPNPHLEEVVQYALSKGWSVKPSKGHCWGRLLCPHNERGGCMYSVNSTPVNPVRDKRRLIKLIDNCPHQEVQEDEDE